MNRTETVAIAGRRLRLSNLDKVLYPAGGFTKGHVIDYYRRIAPVLLPHLRDRPLTLKRYPEGVEREFFYEKECPSHRPGWLATVPIWSEGNRKAVNYCLINDLPSLVWAANLADLELHTSLSTKTDIERPTMLVFDLDPGEPAGLLECARVGVRLFELFAELGLDCFAKTTGSKGIQVYVPLNTPVTYADTKPFAHAVAQLLEKEHPDKIVSNMKKELRRGKVLIDWSQNDAHKTTVCVYSLRARARPTVSTPVGWNELREALAQRDKSLLEFDHADALARVEESGDLFAPVLRLAQHLPQLG